jgi:hypothetical protein
MSTNLDGIVTALQQCLHRGAMENIGERSG